jgi:uncharacterized membrane protein YcaP (DUF421 family)
MDFFNNLLGLDVENLEAYQMAARAVIIFFISLLFVRIAGIRTLGKQTAFDTLTALMLGSIMGRSVVVAQSFFGSVLAVLVIMILHRLAAWITFKSKKAGKIIKGEKLLLIKNGMKQNKNLRKSHITEEDILEALRYESHMNSLDKITEVYLERSGEISVIKKEQ